MSRKSSSFRILAAVLLLAIIMELVSGSSGSFLSSRQFTGPLVVTPSFSYSPTNPAVGQVVTFTGSATGGSPPYSFTWNFGDGGTASGSIVKHIFITLQTFTVAVTATDSIGGTNSFQNSVYLGSLNPKVNCTPTIVRITDITANQTGMTSFNTSPFSPGITTTVSGGVAKRWLTPGPTPSGWHSPGPACIITNNSGHQQPVFVEIDGIKRASAVFEDSSNSYDPTNGGASYVGGTRNDFTFNAFDPAIVSNYQTSCTSNTDPTCFGRMHFEMDHDWQAAGYCGTGTACDPNALSTQTTAAVTLIDFQGFVFWDGPSCCSAQDHSFSGWELHPLTGWRIHQTPLTVSISSSPSSPSSGQTVTFTGTVSGGTGSYTLTWDFGDGATSTGNPATHSYPAGAYNVHLSVSDSNGSTGVVSKTITVGSGTTPDFSISSAPSSLTIQTSSLGTSTINLSSLNGFSGTVFLSSSVTPAAMTASLNPVSVSLSSGGSGSSTLSVSSSIAGNYTLTVTGTSGSLSHSTTVTVSVVSPDFSTASSPSSLWVQSGSPSTTTVQLASLNSFSGNVALSTSVSRSGLIASVSPDSVTLSSGGTGSSTLTLSSSTAGIYSVTVTGISGSLSHSATVTITGVSSLIASDAAAGPASLGTSGGEKLIQDSVGKMIAVYVDGSGRIGLAYDNSDPMLGGWSTPVKSSVPASAYARPAAVLVSLTSLRIIAEGGSGAGLISDIPVGVQRDSQNNIIGLVFGTPVVLDSSGLARYPTAIMAHNGDILSAWSWQNSTRTMVKSLRWDTSTGWTNLARSSNIPDIVLLDSAGITWFLPNIVERPDNNNVYLLANRLSGPPSTLAYDKASWNGSAWSWGTQNLTFESNSSTGVEDPIGFAWDPVTSLMVVSYGITGTQSFGVFTLNLLDLKTHLDTPSLAITERDWGTVSVHITTGDFYLFLMNVNTDGGSGTLGYIRHPAGGSWNSTITPLDTASDNQGLDLRATGTSPTLDMLYAEGTSAPAKVKFVRLSPLNPPNFSLAATPNGVTIQAGSPGGSTITLTSLYNFTGTINLSATVSPSGLTASLNPASVTLASGGTATSTLTLSSTKPGAYTITVQGTSGSVTRSVIVTVIVTDVGPTVTFTESATTVPTSTAVTLTISASDLDGTVTSLKVVWGDGTIDSLAGTATSDSHSYPLAGSYTVYVNATDNASITTKSATAVKTITDRPPTVSFTESATTAPTGSSLSLTISAIDPDGTISSLKVVWGDGTIDNLAGSATTDNHSYALAGSYHVYVNATDNSGSTTKSAVSTKTITDRPPTVSFTESATTVSTGTSISLIITANDPDGTVSSLKVSWGDGTVDSLAGSATSDTHAYSSTGNAPSVTFTVYVNATDNSGSTTKSSGATKTITDRPPTVSFSESSTTAPTGTSIALTITATDPDGTVASMKASWGDGTVDNLVGTATSDSHSYPLAGSYIVYVNATDTANLTTKSSTATKTITDRPPIVGFTESATTGPTGTSITLTITASDPDGTVTGLRVSWGDGKVDSLPGTTTSDSHSYALPGQYGAYVNATDNASLTTKSSIATKTITDRPPVISFTESATTLPTGTTITLTVTSSDPDGTVSSIKVVWGDGTIDNLAGTATSDSHPYALAGSYNVYANATDNGNLTTKSSVSTKTVTDRAPTVSFTESASTVPTGTPITLIISTSDPDGTVSSIKVSWEDGTVDSLPGSATSDSHSYPVAGSYNVYVNATDNGNLTSKSTVSVKTITDRSPTISFSESATTAPTGTSIILTLSASDPDGNVTGIKVAWGDGTVDNLAGTAASDSHAYSLAGTYQVYLNATDNANLTTKSTDAIKTITDRPPVVSFTESATTAQTGTSISLTITSFDPDGIVSNFRVSWGDGTVDTLAGSATTDSHAYSVANNYSVYVNATDNSGSITKSSVATKTITDRPPTVIFTESTSNGFRDQPMTLTISSSDPDGAVTSLSVDWGDGTIDILGGTATVDSHAYVKAGRFTINVTATDNAGMTGSTTAGITITDAPPTVSFTASPTAANTGQTITLTISSIDSDGTIMQTVVNWGDGTVHTLSGGTTADSHAYGSTGNAKTQSFTVMVTVTDNATLTGTSTALVTINDLPPTASFTKSAASASTGEAIIFNATASGDPDGTIVNYSWTFGDGGTATGVIVGHTYTNTSGAKTLNYTVTFTVTDNSGYTATAQSTETINDRSPVASFTESTTSALTGTSITFNATTSSDPDGTITGYSWSYGDSNTGIGNTASHSYAVAGNYSVTLTVTDNSGNQASSMFTETILDRPPVLFLSSSSLTSLTLNSIGFNATGSFDPDGSIVGYAWNLGDGSTASGITTIHAYARAGNYTVVLGVTDNGGLASFLSVVETVLDRAPTAAFTYSPASPLTGQTVGYDASSSSDPDGTIASYAWSFGDGATGSGFTIQHSYATNGTFTVLLTVTDDNGSKATTSATVAVGNDPAPVFLPGSSLNATNVAPRSLTLSWTPAVDSVQVTAYRVYVNGTLLATLPGNDTSYSVTGLSPLAHYLFHVEAGNPSGNHSTNGPSTRAFTDLQGDVNHDCTVDLSDLILVGSTFGSRLGETRYNTNADLNHDGTIDLTDLILVGSNFGQTC